MLKTKNLSIMFTDMKGFTARTATHSRKQLHHLLELQDELIKPAIKQFDGNIVKTIGDAFMVSFESPTDAVLCGMKIQENVLNHNSRSPSTDQIEVRIAVNSGEVNIKDKDVFGEPVNVASRIEAIAEPNEVYFTESVFLTMNRNEIPTAEVGHRKLKGIPEEIKVYKVMSEQTNLIRAKLKREQMAKANAKLAKDEININQEKPQQSENIQEALEDIQEQGAEEFQDKSLTPKQPDKLKKFWQKYNKWILIALFAFLLLIIISLGAENKKLEREKNWESLSQEQQEQLREKIPQLQKDFNQAVKDQDIEKINDMLDSLFKFSQGPPPELIEPMKNFVNEQLKNPELTPRQKDQLRKIKKNLQ